MTTNTLMKIESDAVALEQLLMETQGEVCPALEEFIAEVENALEAKADGYAAVMARFESSADLMRSKAELYTNAARALENARERLRDRIKATMIVLGREEIAGQNIRFKLQNGAPKLILDDPKAIPPAFTITEMIISADKDAIKAALKEGEKVNGAHLEPVRILCEYIKKG